MEIWKDRWHETVRLSEERVQEAMFKKKSNGKNTYGIIGLGRFGHALALELAAAGADLVVLDREEEKVRELREHTENAYVVHALDKKTRKPGSRTAMWQ